MVIVIFKLLFKKKSSCGRSLVGSSKIGVLRYHTVPFKHKRRASSRVAYRGGNLFGCWAPVSDEFL
jgi:hypothetical protein